MKEKLGGKIMIELVGLRAKLIVIDNGYKDNRAKGKKKVCQKKKT